jgi:hypothetical protein
VRRGSGAALLGALCACSLGGTPPEPLQCQGAASSLADHLLVGYAGDLSVARGGGFDLRYQYLAGGLFDGGAPCASCASGCTAAGTPCDNGSGGCGWWGCWQDDRDPPGQFVTGFAAETAGAGLIPWITYYEELQASGLAEGTAQLAALDDPAFMTRYYADVRFLLGRLAGGAAFLHLEPDLWGYLQHRAASPAAIPARVGSVNPDCAGLPETAGGFGRCLVAMARLHAPSVKVGLHASPWASGSDCVSNALASLDVAAEGRRTADFLLACGGGQADFVAADLSDRDAGWYQTVGRDSWLDATDRTLPSFAQALTWSRAVAERMGVPIVWWQVPVGNMALANVSGAWQDNKLDYLFDHPERVVAGGAVGMAFGAGAGGQTTPMSDGGHLAARARALAARGGQPLCAP